MVMPSTSGRHALYGYESSDISQRPRIGWTSVCPETYWRVADCYLFVEFLEMLMFIRVLRVHRWGHSLTSTDLLQLMLPLKLFLAPLSANQLNQLKRNRLATLKVVTSTKFFAENLQNTHICVLTIFAKAFCDCRNHRLPSESLWATCSQIPQPTSSLLVGSNSACQ